MKDCLFFVLWTLARLRPLQQEVQWPCIVQKWLVDDQLCRGLSSGCQIVLSSATEAEFIFPATGSGVLVVDGSNCFLFGV